MTRPVVGRDIIGIGIESGYLRCGGMYNGDDWQVLTIGRDAVGMQPGVSRELELGVP